MALNKSALSELLDALRAGGDLDVIREGLALVLQALIDVEATQHIGARPDERSEQRTAHRNGTRSRLLSTKAGDVELRIPKLREGSFFPALLEPRRRIDRALLAVVMEADVHGTSTRKVDDLVKALGSTRGSPSPRSPGSVSSSTPRWPASGPGRWPTPASRTCSWTPPTSRPESTGEWSPERWSSPPG
jgi:transposase-like protein